MAELKYIGKNILNHELQVKNGKIIGDHTEVIRVTVVSDGGNKYAFEGATTPDFTIDEGKTYRFDQSDSTNDNHPFRFSTVENGTWGGGSAYTTGVVTHGTPGVKGAYTEISVTKVTPNHLYYYCTQHSGMGNDAVLIKNDFSNLHRVSGSATSTGSFGRIFAAGDIYATGEVSADSFVSRDGSETISFQDDVSFGADDSITSILNITASGEISASSFVGIFQGALSGSAQIASNISGAFSVASASFAADILSNSSSFATRITTDSSSFSTRITKNEGTGSKILNGQLEFTNITASGNISSSGNITGNILNVKTRVKAIGSSLEFAGNTLDFVDGSSVNRLFKGTAGGSFEAYHAGTKKLETTTGGINVTGNITGSGDLQIAGNISGSATSTGSFGKLSIASGERGIDIGSVPTNWDSQLNILGTTSTTGIKIQAPSSGNAQIKMYSNAGGTNNDFWYMQATNGGTFDIVNYGPGSFTNMVSIAGNTGHMTVRGNISGSVTSTGSFGHVKIPDYGRLSIGNSNDLQIYHNGSHSFIKDGGTGNLILRTNVFQVKNADNNETMIQANEDGAVTLFHDNNQRLVTQKGGVNITGNITGSGHLSMSLSSTGSFGRVQASTIGGNSPLVVDSTTTFASAVTASSPVKFDNQVFINNIFTSSLNSQMDLQGKVILHTGSIVGAFDITTKSGSSSDSMRFGKAENALRISGSGNVSRFATGSDGSIIDLGFTILDEDGNKVLSGDGDGIHVDSNNYWYNNRFYRVGNATTQYLSYDDTNIKYRGEVILNTGSFEGDVYIKTNNDNMIFGRSTTGLSVSGSSGVSRFATGSEGEIIDLGFTVTDEEGNVTITNTGDGIHVDSNNYWYTSGHFRIGDVGNYIDWNTNNLTISGAFSGSFRGDVTATEMHVDQYITHNGDSDTKINFLDDEIRFEVGNLLLFDIHKKGSAPHEVTVNSGANNVDFVVKDNDNDVLFRTDADADNVLFPAATKISGSAQSTGSFGSLQINGAAIDFSNVPTSDPGIAGRVWRDGTDLKISTG